MDFDDVRKGFVDSGFPESIIDEVLEAYTEAKRRFHLSDLRPQEVEGGRFSEGVFRLLQHASGQKMTPLGRRLPSLDKLLPAFESSAGKPDSVRLHIPRTLRLIYGIRNTRDAAHLGDGIDPNLQDATLVVRAMDWTLAELVRLYHDVDADRAQQIIENLMTKEVPAVEEIDGHPVILADLKPREQALLLLYRAGAEGASIEELVEWLRLTRADHLRDRLAKLDKEKLVLRHPKTDRYYLTRRGVQVVEERGLAQSA